MTEPTTPADARRQGLNKSRWVATGVAVGTAALLTGVIAGVNSADGTSTSPQQLSVADADGFQPAAPYDGSRRYESDDEYEYDDDGRAQPFDPRQQAPTFNPPSGSSTQQSPSFGPQTRSGGS
jgi:hypothetical protein